jgi:septal ring factor EnvC (AmiA/AmiB activator)
LPEFLRFSKIGRGGGGSCLPVSYAYVFQIFQDSIGLMNFIFQLIECKSDLKQYQSKTQDVERELHFLRTQCKKIESERTELSTELGNCLKERNRLVGRTAELEKLTRYDKQGE